MGIGTLRRYHDDSRVVGETPLPEGAVDAAQEEAAEVAGAQSELENDRKLNEAADALQAAVLAVYQAEDGADHEALANAAAEAGAAYAEAFKAQADAESREPITPSDQPDNAQTDEVRGDPEGQESKGDREPVVTVKADGDERSQGDATPDPLAGHWSNGDPVHIITDGETRTVAPNQNGAEWVPDAPSAEEDPAGGSENPGGEDEANDGTRVSTAHGDIERPGVTASTDAWINYAKADPKGEPFDLTKRPGLRDDLVAHYGA